VFPRVLAVHTRPALDDIEVVVAADGEAAIASLRDESFDAVYVDLSLPALDGWVVLSAVGSWSERPRLVAQVADRADIERAHALGADVCVLAGTAVHARALHSAWHPHRKTSSRRTTTSGAPA
jgi:DNA-binding NarL/FixJ family response regulator